MLPRWMDELLPLLPTLISLARTGSVSQTARSLGVPRSTVSRRLVRIEAVVGFQVAERTNHRFALTGAGRRLVDGAVEAIARLETVHDQARVRDGQVCGLLRVAMPAGATGSFGSWFFAFLNARHPLIEIEVTVTDRRALRLEEGFDLVMVLGMPPPSSWMRRRLSDSVLLAVASPRYLKRKGTPTTIDDLHEHLLLVHASAGVTPAWPRLCGGEFPVRPHLVANDLSVLRDTAVSGLGIALVPIHIALAELAAGALVHVLPTLVGQVLEISALYLPERRESPVLRAVLAAISDFAKEQAQAPSTARWGEPILETLRTRPGSTPGS